MSKGSFDDIGDNKEALDKLMGGAAVSIKTPKKKKEPTSPLQVTVSTKVKKNFKSEASKLGMSMNDYFLKVYSFYKEHGNMKS